MPKIDTWTSAAVAGAHVVRPLAGLADHVHNLLKRQRPTAGAITYMVDGGQYVLMPAGTTLTAFALAEF